MGKRRFISNGTASDIPKDYLQNDCSTASMHFYGSFFTSMLWDWVFILRFYGNSAPLLLWIQSTTAFMATFLWQFSLPLTSLCSSFALWHYSLTFFYKFIIIFFMWIEFYWKFIPFLLNDLLRSSFHIKYSQLFRDLFFPANLYMLFSPSFIIIFSLTLFETLSRNMIEVYSAQSSLMQIFFLFV